MTYLGRVRVKRWVQKAYAKGFKDGSESRWPDPGQMEQTPSRYIRAWELAYPQGFSEGRKTATSAIMASAAAEIPSWLWALCLAEVERPLLFDWARKNQDNCTSLRSYA
jgi:hypothetical protein